MNVQERVANGFNWLLTHRPNTIADIDPEIVDVTSVYFCPLGQSGGYLAALQDVGYFDLFDLDYQWCPWEHGFADVGPEDFDDDETIDALNAEWHRVLTAHQRG